MNNLATLFIISAPSGGGKTSLVNALIQDVANLAVSISHTTRQPRPGEENGRNYHFINETEFKSLIKKDAFLEHAKVFDNYYGTSREWLESKLKVGVDVILEIDWQGAEQIRKKMPNCVSIFLIPPSWSTLENRLRERGQDDPAIIAKRMAAARAEISHYHEYDYMVVNGDFQQALLELKAIIISQRLKLPFQQHKCAVLLNSLLK